MAIRYDLAQLEPPTKLDNGYLRADAIITRTGVFSYLLHDGSIRNELRVPEEVFNADAMRSFKQAPLTNDHPSEQLNSKNTRKFQVGSVIDVNKHMDALVKASVLITDEEAINAAEGGKRQLSCGYTCDLEDTSGVTMGIPGVDDGLKFDAIQRNIRGNHVALVERGRAGPEASLHLDASDGVQVERTNTPTRKKPMKTVRIDGVDYEVSEQAAQAISKVMAKHDANAEAVVKAKDEATKAQAKADQLEADNKELQAKLDKAGDPASIKEAIKERVDLEKKADAILGEGHDIKLDEASDVDIKRAVILKVSPEAKLDDKDDAYIDARFDQAVESFKPDTTTQKNDQLHSVNHAGNDTQKKQDESPVLSARERMTKDNFEAGRKPLNA